MQHRSFSTQQISTAVTFSGLAFYTETSNNGISCLEKCPSLHLYVLLEWNEVICIATALPEMRQSPERSKITPLGDQGSGSPPSGLVHIPAKFFILFAPFNPHCQGPGASQQHRAGLWLCSGPGRSTSARLDARVPRPPARSLAHRHRKDEARRKGRSVLNHQLLLAEPIEGLVLQVVPHPGISSRCLAPNLCQDAGTPHKMGKAQREKKTSWGTGKIQIPPQTGFLPINDT